MAQKVKRATVKTDDEKHEEIINGLENIRSEIRFTHYQDSPFVIIVAMILLGVGGISVIAGISTEIPNLVRINGGVGLGMIGLALYVGRSIFAYRRKFG